MASLRQLAALGARPLLAEPWVDGGRGSSPVLSSVVEVGTWGPQSASVQTSHRGREIQADTHTHTHTHTLTHTHSRGMCECVCGCVCGGGGAEKF